MLELALLVGVIVVATAVLKKRRQRGEVAAGGSAVTQEDIDEAQRFGGGGAIEGPTGQLIREHARIKPVRAPPEWVPYLRRLWRGEDVLVRPERTLPFVATWSSLDPRLLPAGAQPGDPVMFLVLGTDGHRYFPMIRHETQIAAWSGRPGGGFWRSEYDPSDSGHAAGEVIPASELIFTADMSGWFFVLMKPSFHFRPPEGGFDEAMGDINTGEQLASAIRSGTVLGRASAPFRHFGNRIHPVLARHVLEGSTGPMPSVGSGPLADGGWLWDLHPAHGVGYATEAELARIGWEHAHSREAARSGTRRVRE